MLCCFRAPVAFKNPTIAKKSGVYCRSTLTKSLIKWFKFHLQGGLVVITELT